MHHLVVTIHRARDLMAADVFTSDPYIEVIVAGCYTKCTRIIKSNLNPIYEEELHFYLLDDEGTLIFRAMDYDYAGPDDNLGFAILDLQEIATSERTTVTLVNYDLDDPDDEEELRGTVDVTVDLEEADEDEISDLGLNEVFKDGVLRKTPGGDLYRAGLKRFQPRIKTQRRWFKLRPSYLAYYKAKLTGGVVTDEGFRIHEDADYVSLFDEDTIVRRLPRRPKINNHALALVTRRRNFHLRADNDADLEDWVDKLGVALQEYSSVMADDEVESFVPRRYNCDAISFNCGRDAYESIADALENAHHEIFIADWWLSPHVLLRMREGQPPRDEDRLDRILVRKAEQGVKIYVLIYREIESVLNLFSQTAKRHLRSLHKNIRVLRHPEASLQNVSNVYWSHHQKLVCVDQDVAYVGGLDLCMGRRDTPDHPCVDNGPFPQYPGVEYYNQNAVKIPAYTDHREDVVDRQQFPRLPWQDIHCRIQGPAARDVARNFIDRWNAHRISTKSRGKQPALVPLDGWEDSNDSDSGVGSCTIQVVRSCGPWSLQLPREQSILNAYRRLIKSAEHYIYIENQFFISSLPKDGIKNNIANLLYQRVADAIEDDRTFRVIVVLPLHPEGDLAGADKTMLAILHYQLKTMCQGEKSLRGRFERDFPDYDFDDYFSFNYLRSWGQFEDGRIVTEAVYVHSKLMIVDDRAVIMGSANINDRSMKGVRDSEIAVVIEDEATIDTTMDGEPYQAARFAYELRVKVWRAHLGISDGAEDEDYDFEDPVCDAFYEDIWRATAADNTDIFTTVFPHIPSDEITDLRRYFKGKLEGKWKGTIGERENDPKLVRQLENGVQGTLCEYPLDFLCDMDLSPSGALAVAGNTVLI